MKRRNEEVKLYHKSPDSDLISLTINKKSYQICFDLLTESSDFILTNFTKNTFIKAINKAQNELNISNEHIELFMKGISGELIYINQINSFDFYKLSSFFKIKSISEKVHSLWQFHPDSFENDICQFLQIFDNSVKNDKQRNYLNDFLQYTQILSKLEQNIEQFFTCQIFDQYSPYFIYFVLINCDPKKIPQKYLFNYLLNSDDDHQILIQFLDFDYLIKEIKDQLFLFIFGRYSQLLKSNEEYFEYTKLGKDDEGSIRLLMQSSRHGNFIASRHLSSMLKDEEEKYDTICKAQKKSSKLLRSFYERISQGKTSKSINNNNNKSSDDRNRDEIKKSDNTNIDRSRSEGANVDKNGSMSKKSDNTNILRSKSESQKSDTKNIDNDDVNTSATDNSTSRSGSNKKVIKKKSSNDDDDDIDDSYFDDDKAFTTKSTDEEDYNSPDFMNANKSANDTDYFNFEGDDKKYKKWRDRPFTEEELLNQEIFVETSSIIESGHYTDIFNNYHDISKFVHYSNLNTKTIDHNQSFSSILSSKFKDVIKWGDHEKNQIYYKIEIINQGTFEAAREMKEVDKIDKVCVLNFASATKPGGGVINGRTAQEETLSRQSSLYFSLIKNDTMYKYFRKNRSPFYKHFMIYSPNVVVFRNENYELIPPFLVSVISSPAVNYAVLLKKFKFGQRDQDVYTCMKNRCRKILELAICEKNKGIVLGAFGCGVFRNKPEDISKIFKELLVDEFYGLFFDKIVFAIKSNPKKKDVNFDVFKEKFTIK